MCLSLLQNLSDSLQCLFCTSLYSWAMAAACCDSNKWCGARASVTWPCLQRAGCCSCTTGPAAMWRVVGYAGDNILTAWVSPLPPPSWISHNLFLSIWQWQFLSSCYESETFLSRWIKYFLVWDGLDPAVKNNQLAIMTHILRDWINEYNGILKINKQWRAQGNFIAGAKGRTSPTTSDDAFALASAWKSSQRVNKD